MRRHSVVHLLLLSLKHTMIPVEDFTGPTIKEIQRFLEITDDARKEGEVTSAEPCSALHCTAL
jgi:protein-tyrosine phosphatase